ncbi:MAG: siderophore-interacting protein [Micropepsaceae bacterium]
MDGAGTDERRAVTKGGLITSAVLKLLTRRAEVSAVEAISPRFKLIGLRGEGLKGANWAPGHKLQVQMSGFSFRTYTPIAWDSVSGHARFLAYAHGDSPGGRWMTDLRPGDGVTLFGPRRSMDMSFDGPVVVTGDETVFGPAAALVAAGREVRCLFEVSDAAESRDVLARIGVSDARLVPRAAGDAHHVALASALAEMTDGRATYVIAGKGATVQRMVRELRGQGVPSGRMRTKAYWVPGKTGID